MMKIAVMMRVMDQATGLGTFTRRLIQTLLSIDRENHYLLLYRRPEAMGSFAGIPNATELLLRWPDHKVLWDQASHVLPMSRFVLDETRKYVKPSLAEGTITYTAPEESFLTPPPPERLAEVRQKFSLPERFVFSSTRVENIGNTGTTFCDSKNVETTMKAWLDWRERMPHALVIAGKRVREFLHYRGWRDGDLEGVRFLNLVPREDMPALYRMADAVVMPSWYEGCPLTMLEAMATGCPIVASSIGSFRELGGDAAVYAPPDSPAELSRQLQAVIEDRNLTERLRAAGRARVIEFTWQRVAKAVLDGLHRAVGQRDDRPRGRGVVAIPLM